MTFFQEKLGWHNSHTRHATVATHLPQTDMTDSGHELVYDYALLSLFQD